MNLTQPWIKKKSISAATECEALWKSVNKPSCTYSVISKCKDLDLIK